MNRITRAVVRLSLLRRSSEKCDSLSRPVAAPRLFSSFHYFSTKTQSQELSAKASTKWPRPSEIPWQVKVANSVNLIGKVQVPVEFATSPDGKSWATTVIAQHRAASSDSPVFWVPVLFEGDLAHIAACHLKEKDLVHISGQLSMDHPPFSFSEKESDFQVLVQDVNFVHGSSKLTKSFKPLKQEEYINISDSMTNGGNPTQSNWSDLIKNPKNWWDYREKKLKKLVKEKHPDFKHKNTGYALWLDSAPTWVLPGLDELDYKQKIKKSKQEDSWRSLVENPDKWWDNRSSKASEKSPDFRHKETNEGLWVGSLPDWVLSQLPVLKLADVLLTGREMICNLKPYNKKTCIPFFSQC